MRVRGVYQSPSAKTAQEDLGEIVAQRYFSLDTKGHARDHLFLLGCNVNSREGFTDERHPRRVREAGEWELPDPTKPTHEDGAALDAILPPHST